MARGEEGTHTCIQQLKERERERGGERGGGGSNKRKKRIKRERVGERKRKFAIKELGWGGVQEWAQKDKV